MKDPSIPSKEAIMGAMLLNDSSREEAIQWLRAEDEEAEQRSTQTNRLKKAFLALRGHLVLHQPA